MRKVINVYILLVAVTEGNRFIGRPCRIWDDNIKITLKRTMKCEGMDRRN